MNFDHLVVSVKKILSAKRFNHTIGVVNTSAMLADRYDVSLESAQIASLLHDIAKEQAYNKLEEQLKYFGELEYLSFSPSVWHAPVGANIARNEFGIKDQDILNAIKYHSTGRPKMTKLEQIVFLADYIEPNRTQPNVDLIRKLATQNLETAVAQTLADTVAYLKSKKEVNIHPDTVAACDYYRRYVK